MLMGFFISLQYKPTDLKVLNMCRLYLQVYSLTDITSADGRYIIPHYKDGIQSQDRKSELRWPTQQRPGKKAWILWKQALQHIETNDTLLQPLGRWLTSPHQKWNWYLDPLTSILYHNADGLWSQSKPLGPTNKRVTRHQSRPLYQPAHLRPCRLPYQTTLSYQSQSRMIQYWP